MKRAGLFFSLVLAAPLSFAAEKFASKDDAEMIVAMAAKMIATHRDETFQEINSKSRRWIHADLYPVVYDMDGKCLAHGLNEKFVGKNLINLTDADGKQFIRERIQLARTQGKFWQDYKFTDPVSKKVLPKTAYCETSGKFIICAGIYKR
jgi:signal transduction histidine kinase